MQGQLHTINGDAKGSHQIGCEIPQSTDGSNSSRDFSRQDVPHKVSDIESLRQFCVCIG
ncbi:hypothetical protein ACLOJK_029921 [Asimina triloba]